jgi:urease accessory protein
MLTANKIVPGSRGLAPALLKRAARVQLGWDQRQKSRFDAVDSSGRQIGFFLQRGAVLRGGDAVVAEDGSLVVVDAAPQPVLVVRHCPHHGQPSDLMRAAYHLGNRHVAVELKPDHLKLEPDHVLAEMLQRMHLIVTPEDAPFEPEAGAYAAEGHAGHDDHGHGDHGHDPAEPAAHGAHGEHAHDHDHGHDHSHGHDHGHAQHGDHGH